MLMKEHEIAKDCAGAREQAIIFQLHDEFFGFNISLIAEITEVVPMNFVPKVPDFVAGAINYHGRIVAVVNLAGFFKLPSNEKGMNARIIVISKDSYGVGFLVDGIKEITWLSREPGEGGAVVEEGADNKYIENILYINETLCNWIDVERLLISLKDSFEGVNIEH